MQVDAGKAAGQALHQGWQQIGGHRRNDPDAQPPDQRVAGGARQIGQFIDRAQNGADAGDKNLTKCRQPHLPRAPFKQRRAQPVLQFPDLHRQRRLRHRAVRRRPAKMPGPRQRVRVAQMFQGQVVHHLS